jgi:hypothetical protein
VFHSQDISPSRLRSHILRCIRDHAHSLIVVNNRCCEFEQCLVSDGMFNVTPTSICVKSHVVQMLTNSKRTRPFPSLTYFSIRIVTKEVRSVKLATPWLCSWPLAGQSEQRQIAARPWEADWPKKDIPSNTSVLMRCRDIPPPAAPRCHACMPTMTYFKERFGAKHSR